MRSNRDATIFQSIGPSFVLTFPDRGCARIKPRRRIPFDSSAHYYSLFGSNNSSTLTCCCTLPFPFLPPFPSPIFHRRTSKTIKDRSTRPLERKEGLFFFNFTTIQWNNPAISLLFLFSFRTDVEKVFWGKHGGSMLNGSGKIFERGKFGLRLFFCFLHILCGWI